MDKLIKYVEFKDFQKLYSRCKNKKLRLSILLGFGSGLRISEIVGFKRRDGSIIPPLTSENVDLSKHQIKIINAKGKKWRITITPPLLNESMLKLLPLKIKRRTLQYQFKVLSKKVLNKNLSFHSLRHGFGNYQANVLKIPLPIVQGLMGHSRLDTTGIYTKVNPEHAIKTSWEAMTKL